MYSDEYFFLFLDASTKGKGRKNISGKSIKYCCLLSFTPHNIYFSRHDSFKQAHGTHLLLW